MNITDQFEVDCTQCLDTGEYYDGKKMVKCTCDAGKKLKDGDDSEGGISKEYGSESN